VDTARICAGCWSVLFFGLFAVTPATAQDSGAGDSGGVGTVILNFEKRKVSGDVMETFYESLESTVDASDEMKTVPGGEVTIQEMIVTAGCQEPNAECLSGLGDYVEGQRMIFGSIKRSGEAYLFTFRMFDFAEKKFVRRATEQTVEGDPATVKEAIPGVVEGFIHGDVGTVRVSARGVDGEAKVYFDGERVGTAPTRLEDMPLGQHAITVETASGAEKTKLVILRKDGEASVAFDFVEGVPVGARGTDTGSGSSPVLGYTAAGVGIAGLVVGIVGQIENADAVDESEALRCNGGDTICNPPGAQQRTAGELAALAEDRDSRVTNTAVISTVGYSVGLIGLGTGGYLLYRHFSGSSNGGESTSKAASVDSVQLRPGPDGVQMGVSLSF